MAGVSPGQQIMRQKLIPWISLQGKKRFMVQLTIEQAIKKDLELSKMLIIAYELSDIIGNNKRQEGYIDFEIEESIIELDYLKCNKIV